MRGLLLRLLMFSDALIKLRTIRCMRILQITHCFSTMMMMMMMMVLFCLSKRTPLLNGLGFKRYTSYYSCSLVQNGTVHIFPGASRSEVLSKLLFPVPLQMKLFVSTFCDQIVKTPAATGRAAMIAHSG
jgi:hypothetical protein